MFMECQASLCAPDKAYIYCKNDRKIPGDVNILAVQSGTLPSRSFLLSIYKNTVS